MRCVACDEERRMPGSEFCRYCVTCANCALHPTVKDRDGTYRERRCATCRCSKCGSGMFRDYHDKVPTERLCQRCYMKDRGLKGCRGCGGPSPSLFRRGDKSATLCTNCVFTTVQGEKRVHYCCFCRNKATTYTGKWIVCADHKKFLYCTTTACSPGTQCRRCVARQRENDRLARLSRERLVLTDYEHEKNLENGECYNDCRACSEVATAPVEFDGVVVFHPDSPTPNPILKMSDRRHIKSNRYISAEIEVAGLHSPQKKDLLMGVVKKWGGRIVHDGSLPRGGFEINTSPAAGDFFYRQLTDIGDALSEAGAYVNNQCGTHIHADARDYRYTDLTRLILYFEKLEPALLWTQPYERGMNNQYCRAVGKQLANAVRSGSLPAMYKKEKGKATPYKTAMITGIYNNRAIARPPRTNHYGHEFGDVHYHSMNLHSWFFRGTVECRIHSGTIVARKVIDWAITWQAIMDRALTITPKEIAAIDDPVAELLRVSPTPHSKTYIQARINTYKHEYDRNRTIFGGEI